jgi:hypothetical protein
MGFSRRRGLRGCIGWAGILFALRARLTAVGREDRLGASVAAAGGLVFAGAPETNVGGSVEQGAVYVFSRPAGGWSGGLHEIARLFAGGGRAGDRLGSSVAVFGRTIVVGASGARSGSRVGQGAVYVFVEPKRGWSGTIRSVAKLTASDGAAGDALGSSVAVSGDTIVAGAPNVSVANPPYSEDGAVYVFARPAHGWLATLHQARKLTAPDRGELRAGGELGFVAGGRAVREGVPDPELVEQAKRRSFSAGYKARILALQLDALKEGSCRWRADC